MEPLAAAAWTRLLVSGSLLAFSAWLHLLAPASPSLATSYAFVNPVIALALGVLVAGDALGGGRVERLRLDPRRVFLIFRGKTASARG
ncbi:MAG: drug/metabolite exporter YedA [Ramlibacter sp.]|nr:drug/metabolite exporter YedA [Ramlibacter sp.]MDB5912422.1 drug/metabolite exporter YedA [Ramlibacter sp.]